LDPPLKGGHTDIIEELKELASNLTNEQKWK